MRTEFNNADYTNKVISKITGVDFSDTWKTYYSFDFMGKKINVQHCVNSSYITIDNNFIVRISNHLTNKNIEQLLVKSFGEFNEDELDEVRILMFTKGVHGREVSKQEDELCNEFESEYNKQLRFTSDIIEDEENNFEFETICDTIMYNLKKIA